MITPGIDAVCSGGLSLVVAIAVIGYGWITEAGMHKSADRCPALPVNGLADQWSALHGLLPTPLQQPKELSQSLLGDAADASVGGHFSGVCHVLVFRGPCVNRIASLGNHYSTELGGTGFLRLALHGTVVGNDRLLCISQRLPDGAGRTASDSEWVPCTVHLSRRLGVQLMGFVQGIFAEQEAGKYLMQAVMSACRLAVFVTFVLGLWGFRQLSHREQKPISIRVWLPWAATSVGT